MVDTFEPINKKPGVCVETLLILLGIEHLNDSPNLYFIHYKERISFVSYVPINNP